MNNIITYLGRIQDPRHAKGIRHQQVSTLIIMIMAILCGHTGLRSMARFAKAHRDMLLEFIPLPRNKVPSLSTFQRITKAIDFDQVCQSFNDWMEQYIKAEKIAIDGKSINSTVTQCNDSQQNFVSLVSLFGQHSHLIWKVGLLENKKVSEIKTVQELLLTLQISKAVFTLDALHCQKKTVQAIIDSDNSYIITVKKNQPKLYKAIVKTSQTSPKDAWSWTQKGHGHPASCRIKVWEAPKSVTEDWAGLQQLVSVRRRGKRNGKEFDTTTHYITSETASAYCLADSIRGHRKIENTLHWTKDVILNEDGCGIKDPHQAATLGILRNIGFNLLTMAGFKSITEGIDAMGESMPKLWDLIANPVKKILRI